MKQLFIAILVALFVSSCSCSGDKQHVSKNVRDQKAYVLGESHGKRAVELINDEGELQDLLLDVRARTSNIRSKLGAQSAADYERGFHDYVKANSDSLAKLLF